MDCLLGCSSGSSDGGTVAAAVFPPALLSGVMKLAYSTPEGRIAIIQLIKSIAKDIKNVKRSV